MALAPRVCVVLPAYNHPQTVGQVLRKASQFFPVFAVDDGSTDDTSRALANGCAHELLRFPSNLGKATALQAGFALAIKQEFTHAITLDADGQHDAADVPRFAAAASTQPEAFIVGQRNLRSAGAPLARRLANTISSGCFRLQTGITLRDTLCGYRVYPLRALCKLHTTAPRYGFELEVLVRAAWAGLPIVGLPVVADYSSPAIVSHFRPLRDLAAVMGMHVRLFLQAPKQRVETRRELQDNTAHG